MKKDFPYSKVIVWGYPLHSHTHSYVHDAYVKTFKYLGYETYWFHDDDYPDPKDFDYTNSFFIGEGFADKNLPINDSSAYFIMYCPSPKKYHGKVKQYIDVRTVGVGIKDHIFEYSLDKEKATKVGPGCYLEPATDGKVRIKNDYHDYEIDDFDRFYISWATNALPHEIDYDDMYIPREPNIYFCGTITTHGVTETISTWRPFVTEAEKAGYGFIYNNPWQNPLSNEEVIRRTRESILAPDIRGPQVAKQGVVTCRLFKNVSYGHLGVTNSKAMYEEMEGKCIFNEDTAQLFHDAMADRENAKLIEEGMKIVKENHTYVNRIDSILSVLK